MKHEDESSFLYDAHVLVRVCSILEFKICFFISYPHEFARAHEHPVNTFPILFVNFLHAHLLAH